MPKRVGIVGAGVAGLAAIKCSLDDGLEPVCFEQCDDIGGLWNYRDDVKEGEPSLYNSCVINTCKEMTCYSDFPIPKEFPNFMSHRYFKRYLDLYAENFKLRNYISFRHSVQSVEKCPDFDLTGKWEIIAKDRKNPKRDGGLRHGVQRAPAQAQRHEIMEGFQSMLSRPLPRFCFTTLSDMSV